MSNMPELRKLNTILFELPHEIIESNYSARSFTLESLSLSDIGLKNLQTVIMETIFAESDYLFSFKISGGTGLTISYILNHDCANLTITSLITRLRNAYKNVDGDVPTHHTIHIDDDDMYELTRKIIVQSVIVYAMTHRENIHIINSVPYIVCAFDSYRTAGASENDYISTWEILQACEIMQPNVG